ncbi:hypothetical protein [Streptomyces sp. enrichment culture]
MELSGERGFERTTVNDIAARWHVLPSLRRQT